MTLLKKGITGFGSMGYLSKKEIRTFLGRFRFPFIPGFDNLIPPSPSSNFWKVPFRNKQDNIEFDMLINAVNWNLALVNKGSLWMDHEYLEFPYELYMQIRSIPGPELPMNPQTLERAFDREELSELNQSEIDQINYWKSRTIGDIIFNGFD